MQSSKVPHCMMNLTSFISISRSVLIYSLFHPSFTTRTMLLLIKGIHSGIYLTETLKKSPSICTAYHLLGLVHVFSFGVIQIVGQKLWLWQALCRLYLFSQHSHPWILKHQFHSTPENSTVYPSLPCHLFIFLGSCAANSMGLQSALLTAPLHSSLQNGFYSILHEVLAICRPELAPAEQHRGQQLIGCPRVLLHDWKPAKSSLHYQTEQNLRDRWGKVVTREG